MTHRLDLRYRFRQAIKGVIGIQPLVELSRHLADRTAWPDFHCQFGLGDAHGHRDQSCPRVKPTLIATFNRANL
jgi:hypothetical protein